VLVRSDKDNSVNADSAILPIPIWEVRMSMDALPQNNWAKCILKPPALNLLGE